MNKLFGFYFNFVSILTNKVYIVIDMAYREYFTKEVRTPDKIAKVQEFVDGLTTQHYSQLKGDVLG